MSVAIGLEFPRLEIDARIDPGIGEIADQRHHQSHQREDIEIAKNDGIVAVERRRVGEKAEPIEREDLSR